MTSEYTDLPKGITLPEFRRLVERFSAFIFEAPLDQREERLRRLHEALDSVYALRSRLDWSQPASNRLPDLRRLRDKHREKAETLFRTSFAFLPSNAGCPNFRPLSQTPALVVFPTEKLSYSDLDSLNAEARATTLAAERKGNDVAWYLRERLPESHEEMMAGQKPPSDEELLSFAAPLRKNDNRELSEDERREYTNDLGDKQARDHAARIAAYVRETRPPLTIFVLTLKRQVDLFGYFLVEASKIKGFDLATIAVIVTPHPNQLARLNRNDDASRLSGRVAYFFAYTGSRQQAGRLLVDELFKLEPGECPKNWPVPPVPVPPIMDDINYRVAPRSHELTCGQENR